MLLQNISPGLRVKTTKLTALLVGTTITHRHLKARKEGIVGQVCGPVGGYGGDVWFVEHEGQRDPADGAFSEVGAYCFDEFEPTSAKLSLHKFYFDAIQRARREGERYGQAMFNHLCSVRPDLSEKVRGSDMDAFYVEKLSDPRWDRFVEYIEKNW